MSRSTSKNDIKVGLLDEDAHAKAARVNASNQRILWISAISFLTFVIAEVIGASVSNSLSLLGDAAAMSIDVFTYFCSIYVERIKARGEKLSKCTRLMTEVIIPGGSVLALLAVSGWVTSDAVNVIIAKDNSDDVDIKFLYGFAAANFLVDAVSSWAFFSNKDDVFKNEDAIEQETSEQDGPAPEKEEHNAAASSFNLNMASAFTHVGGDTLRTAAIFFAAVVTSLTSIPGSKCDAWADVIVTITIVVLVIPLLKEITSAYFSIQSMEE